MPAEMEPQPSFGEVIKQHITRLVADGYYDLDELKDYRKPEFAGIIYPSIYAEFVLKSGETISCQAPLDNDDESLFGPASRYGLDIEFPIEFENDLPCQRYLALNVDEGTDRIGHIARCKIYFDEAGEPVIVKRDMIHIDHEPAWDKAGFIQDLAKNVGQAEPPPLSAAEYRDIESVLRWVDPRIHAVKPFHLRDG
ncbi:MAG TPA: hypothetical protein VGA08_03795 [Candidatus Saccharimonadales bacterium]